jgi:hypothetical protein
MDGIFQMIENSSSEVIQKNIKPKKATISKSKNNSSTPKSAAHKPKGATSASRKPFKNTRSSATKRRTK